MGFLTLEGVSKVYGGLAAVRDVDLAVARGEFVSLLGPSGCGKTTTLQMIAGLVEPTGGRIGLDGRDITREKPNRRGLGVVFQSYALFPHMTVAENVAFGLEMRKVPRAERDRRVAEMLALVHLANLAERYPRQLSGGQRQRVAIARALVIAPPVLLLDEPLSNLDAKLREEMQFELRRIQRSVGTTTIMVTHDQAEALSISDRVVVMEAGRMTQIDAPYRLYEQPATAFISTFVGKMNRLAGVWRDGGVAVAGTVLASAPADVAAGAAVTASIRPEKLHLRPMGEGRLAGRVASRFFLGGHWLLTVGTEAGDILVSVPNTGEEPAREGEPVGLDWAPASLRVEADAGAAA
ncbi:MULTISPECIES: ABC transporter ATP-binding protein [Chelatococcus]|uniref:Putative spermidine/putrescine transport system ATP-binding protein n=1 Tax=Chelatococcus caeni TaxID=1348468 RepID=A0A840BTF3_9HYPH|nr:MULTISPECIES: ABC transporter ATP-binding protein [Chelatococcus]ALA19007.1 spermidine/putrescine ABC transporter ATPase [Chelatococcus sp. CO-6]MBB4016260.1 putative spermidine/putrescine transport system ATP-binding protein [Chelatococcus caeni]